MTDPDDFRRFFLNRRAERRANNWLLEFPGAWGRCLDPALELADASMIAAGVDMSLKGDTASVCFLGLVDDGDVQRVVDRTRIFTAPPEGRIDFGEVKACIRDGAHDAGPRLLDVSYDPRFMELIAQDLEDEGVPMLETPQSPERMVPAFALLLDLIVTGTLAHDGNVEVGQQVAAAVWRNGERGRTLSKGKSGAPIDACYAKAMAAAALFAHPETEEPPDLW